MTWSPSHKRGGMTLMTGVLQWMAISSSEETGEEREAVGWLCMSGTALTVIELDDCDDKVECFWEKGRGKANKADILLGSVIDHPTRMKRQMKFSTSGWQKAHNH